MNDVEKIRSRPGMYVGGTDEYGRLHLLHRGGGVSEYLRRRVWFEACPPLEVHLTHRETRVDFGLIASRGHTTQWYSFANLERTTEQGTHVVGAREAVVDALAKVLDAPTGAVAAAVDQCIVGFVSIDRETVKFLGPTKTKVGTPEVADIVREAIRPALEAYFGGVGRPIVELVRKTYQSS